MNDQTNSSIPQEQLDVIFHYGAYPLWVYLRELFEIDIVEVCKFVTKEEPVLKTDTGNFVVRVVTLPHENTIGKQENDTVIFLLNSINTVYKTLQAGVKKNDTFILHPYKFKLDSDNNMLLVDSDTEMSITNKALAVVEL